MNINLSLSAAPSIAQALVVVIYKASNPSVAIDHIELPAPHLTEQHITFPDVDPVTYIVNTYETSGWPTLGVLRHSFIYDPSFYGAEIRPTEFLEMNAGDTTYTDPTWEGWKIESIERVGSGTQYQGQNINITSTSFNTVLPGDFFGDHERFVVRFYPRITTYNPTISSANIITDFVTITTDTTLDLSHVGKALLLQSDTSTLSLELPDVTGVPALKTMFFLSNGGNHLNVSINAATGQAIKYLKQDLSAIVLGQSEELHLISTGSEWIVLKCSEGVQRAGIVNMHYISQPLNMVFADGTLKDRLVYPRLWAAVLAMDSASRVDELTWNASSPQNKGKYSTGDGSTNFRLPLLPAVGYMKGVDGAARKAGSYTAHQTGYHRHANGIADDLPNSFIYGFTTDDTPGASTQDIQTSNSARNKQGWTSGNYNYVNGLYVKATTTTETEVSNYGVYLQISI